MDASIEREHLESPIGWIEILVVNGSLSSLACTSQRGAASTSPGPVSQRVRQQLEEYFAGVRKNFDIPLSRPLGTPFQNEIWAEMSRIPFSETVSYGELARRVGRPRAARAVGQACNKNPWPIVIPCHRVVAHQGEGGYALGLSAKRKLLHLERRVVLKLGSS